MSRSDVLNARIILSTDLKYYFSSDQGSFSLNVRRMRYAFLCFFMFMFNGLLGSLLLRARGCVLKKTSYARGNRRFEHAGHWFCYAGVG